MAKLIYALNMSLDGYTEDANGSFDWGASEDVESHAYICETVSKFRTHLYGRKIYEKMVYWETAHQSGDLPGYLLEFARRWQSAEKIVYSKTLAEPRSERTTIEREFDADAIRRLKAEAVHDINVAGSELAAQAIRAGLVDGFLMLVYPVLVGGGKRFFPDGLRLNLELIEERRLRNGVIVLRYDVRNGS
jgi:dihydrofolate reductase